MGPTALPVLMVTALLFVGAESSSNDGVELRASLESLHKYCERLTAATLQQELESYPSRLRSSKQCKNTKQAVTNCTCFKIMSGLGYQGKVDAMAVNLFDGSYSSCLLHRECEKIRAVMTLLDEKSSESAAWCQRAEEKMEQWSDVLYSAISNSTVYQKTSGAVKAVGKAIVSSTSHIPALVQRHSFWLSMCGFLLLLLIVTGCLYQCSCAVNICKYLFCSYGKRKECAKCRTYITVSQSNA